MSNLTCGFAVVNFGKHCISDDGLRCIVCKEVL